MTTAASRPRAPYIMVVGGEGAGKTSQLARLKQELVNQPLPFETVFTREPGGTPVGERIRSFLLSGDGATPTANAVLFFADKAETTARVVRPALESGNPVVSDRGFIDTLVYNIQIEGLGSQEPLFWHLVDALLEIPTLAILLDVDTATGLARRRDTGDVNRYDALGGDFHERINAAYRRFWSDQAQGWLNRPELASQEYFRSVVRKLGSCRFVRIDANRDPRAVYTDLADTIGRHLQEYAGAFEDFRRQEAKEAPVVE